MSDFTIIVTPNYYSGTINAPSTHRLALSEAYPDDDRLQTSVEGHEIAVFDSREEAQAVIDNLTSGPYCCSNGEAGRPSYEIVGDDDDNRLAETIYRDDLYPNSPHIEAIDEEDIPAEIVKEVTGSNVEYSSRYNDNYDIYRGDAVEHGDHWYFVAFVVSTLAVQDADGDLSCLNWDNPIYFREEI